jgi:hydrogenase nickel incorporation protein HypA/HybF
MHEFSIVQSIVEIALETARVNGAGQISSVEVEVGQSAGVVREAMEFAWEAAGRNTLLEGASLVLKEIPLVVRCRSCQKTFQPDELFDPCPVCGDLNPEIISGKELRVVAIEIKNN